MDLHLVVPFNADSLIAKGKELMSIGKGLNDIADFDDYQNEAVKIAGSTTAVDSKRAPVATATIDAPTDGELDNHGQGVVWDARIHSASKKMTTKGVWARRKNVDDAVFDSVMLELTARNQGEPVAQQQTQAAPVGQVFVPPAQTQSADDVFNSLEYVAQAAPVVQQQTQATPVVLNGGDLAKKVIGAMTTGTIELGQIVNVLAKYPGIDGKTSKHVGQFIDPNFAGALPKIDEEIKNIVLMQGGSW